MRLLALLSLFPLLQVALAQDAAPQGGRGGGHGPRPTYCGTTTITKDWYKTITEKAPAVTSTFTKPKHMCYTTETYDAVTTATDRLIITSTYTYHPERTITRWVPAITYTKTKTRTKETCKPTDGGYGWKRALVDEEDEEETASLSNAERIQRGLPLRKPAKRQNERWPRPPKPSCVPSTSTVWDIETSTKTVTPTSWTVTTSCKYTKTIDVAVYSTTTVTRTRTRTKTVQGETITSKITLTPTTTETRTRTKTIITGDCYPTYK